MKKVPWALGKEWSDDYDKAVRVVHSCKTEKQLEVARRYVDLHCKKYDYFEDVWYIFDMAFRQVENEIKPKKFSYYYC